MVNDRCTSVVVVTYWSQETIGACLSALLASSVPLDIFVVDNASGDGTRASVQRFIAAGHPVQLVSNDHNPGFGAACNQGAAMATGSVVLFLNPDAFVDVGSIGRLREVIESTRKAGLVGCRVVDEAGLPSGPQRRREPTWRQSLVTSMGLARLESRWPALAGVEMPDPSDASLDAAVPRASSVEVVDAVNGSVMMLPMALFRELGGFDADFTLHAEDLDLCRRVRDAGFQVLFVPDVVVRHIGGVSSRRRPFWVEWQKTRSLWRYFRKHDRAARNPLVMTLVAAGLGLRYLARMPAMVRARSRA